jgi:hypothetical protein
MGGGGGGVFHARSNKGDLEVFLLGGVLKMIVLASCCGVL